MTAGDKLLCKKEICVPRSYNLDYVQHYRTFYVGRFYKIHRKVSHLLKPEYIEMFILSEYDETDHAENQGLWFSEMGQYNPFEYFYSPKELRKLKLEKLNEK